MTSNKVVVFCYVEKFPIATPWLSEEEKSLISQIDKNVDWEKVASSFENEKTANDCKLQLKKMYMTYSWKTKEKRVLYITGDSTSAQESDDFSTVEDTLLDVHGFVGIEKIHRSYTEYYLTQEAKYQYAVGSSPGLKDVEIDAKYDFDCIVIEWGEKSRELVELLKKLVGARRPYTVALYNPYDDDECVPCAMHGVNAWFPKPVEPEDVAEIVKSMEDFNFAV